MRTCNLCKEGSCCPEVVVDNDTVVITDDDGGRVKLTTEQIRILWEKLQ